MTLILIGLAAVALWALVRLGRQGERPGRGQWRVSATLLSAALLGGGGLAAFRGLWLWGFVLMAAGLWLAVASRIRAVSTQAPTMDRAEARALLGVDADATPEQINTAWRRLMARAHPDQGGTAGLAAQLNAARDRLLK